MTERKPNRQRFQKDNGIKRILLVDDEYDIGLVIKLVLEGNGFKVGQTRNIHYVIIQAGSQSVPLNTQRQ
ncbi:MAG: hypothetical protein WA364_12450 [Candidatus Nitrosopolaris sp.]